MPRAPKEFFGVVPQTLLTDEDLDRMAPGQGRPHPAGLPVGRVGPRPNPTNEVDFSSIDPIVLKRRRERRSRVIPTIYGTPPWVAEGLDGNDCGDECAAYAPSSDEALAAWKDFVGQLVDRYGPDGELWNAHPEVDPEPIRTWQIWNEQNSPTFYQPEVDPAGYTKLVESASAAITERDPEAEVILGGMFGTPFQGKPPALSAWEFLRQMYAIDGCPRQLRRGRRPSVRGARGEDRGPGRAHPRGDRSVPTTTPGSGSPRWAPPPTRARTRSSAGPRARRSSSRDAFEFFIDQREQLDIEGVTWYSWRDSRHPPVRLVRRVGPVRGGLADAEAGLGRVRLVHRRVLTPSRRSGNGRGQRPPAIAGRITTVSDSPTAVSSPSSTRTSSSLR